MAAQQTNHIISSEDKVSFDVSDMLIDGDVGFLCGAWGGDGASYGNSGGIMNAGKKYLQQGLFNHHARKHYVKTAHKMGGEYVMKPLLKSLAKTTVGATVVTAKNIFAE